MRPALGFRLRNNRDVAGALMMVGGAALAVLCGFEHLRFYWVTATAALMAVGYLFTSIKARNDVQRNLAVLILIYGVCILIGGVCAIAGALARRL
jgi:hypothetical protein